MDEEAPPITNGNNAENPPMKHNGEEVHPVVWTPEDASRFLSAAIHEAQKPLADALKQRPATTPVLALIVGILIVASVAIGWILSSQLSKSESSAETARSSRDSALAQQYELQSKADTLEARLAAAKDEQDRLSQEYAKENESLRGQAEGKRDNEEELRKAQAELVRFRRQNELLKSQISGLEMEKLALARQLDAVKAMAIDEDPGDYVTIEEPPIPGPATPAAPEEAQPEAPPAESAETTVSKAEPPSEEAPKLDEAKASAPEPAATEAPAIQVGISDSETPTPTDGTVTVEAVAGNGRDTGTLTLGANGQNPPTLYEASQAADETAPIQITSSAAPLPEAEAEPVEEKVEEKPEIPEEPVAPEPEAIADPTPPAEESGESVEEAVEAEKDAGAPAQSIESEVETPVETKSEATASDETVEPAAEQAEPETVEPEAQEQAEEEEEKPVEEVEK